jgi:hypothetical protein
MCEHMHLFIFWATCNRSSAFVHFLFTIQVVGLWEILRALYIKHTSKYFIFQLYFSRFITGLLKLFHNIFCTIFLFRSIKYTSFFPWLLNFQSWLESLFVPVCGYSVLRYLAIFLLLYFFHLSH